MIIAVSVLLLGTVVLVQVLGMWPRRRIRSATGQARAATKALRDTRHRLAEFRQQPDGQHLSRGLRERRRRVARIALANRVASTALLVLLVVAFAGLVLAAAHADAARHWIGQRPELDGYVIVQPSPVVRIDGTGNAVMVAWLVVGGLLTITGFAEYAAHVTARRSHPVLRTIWWCAASLAVATATALYLGRLWVWSVLEILLLIAGASVARLCLASGDRAELRPVAVADQARGLVARYALDETPPPVPTTPPPPTPTPVVATADWSELSTWDKWWIARRIAAEVASQHARHAALLDLTPTNVDPDSPATGLRTVSPRTEAATNRERIADQRALATLIGRLAAGTPDQPCGATSVTAGWFGPDLRAAARQRGRWPPASWWVHALDVARAACLP